MKLKIRFFLILISLLAGGCGLLQGLADGDPTPPSGSEPESANLPLSSGSLKGEWRQPPLNASWQWQLTGEIELSDQARMIDLDLFETSPALIKELHKEGRYLVCYISAGSWEDWRPDAERFPGQVLGKNYTGWPGEKWLDIRQIDLLAPILRDRLDLCAVKGFDGVEPDNIDGYTNNTGFPLTYQDQLTFNIWLAQEAHARGLSIGLKNDPEQIPDLLPYYDWALTEDCFADGWCEDLQPFIQAGKPVFTVEYTDTGLSLSDFCPQARELGLNAILKNRELDGYIEACP